MQREKQNRERHAVRVVVYYYYHRGTKKVNKLKKKRRKKKKKNAVAVLMLGNPTVGGIPPKTILADLVWILGILNQERLC